jgi:hypothetical protein
MRQDEIEKLQDEQRKYEEEMVRLHCPFKVGDRVEIAPWWNNDRIEKAIVLSCGVYIDEDSIDGVWRIVVQPCKKDFTHHQGKHPVTIGRRAGDYIKHYEEP